MIYEFRTLGEEMDKVRARQCADTPSMSDDQLALLLYTLVSSRRAERAWRSLRVTMATVSHEVKRRARQLMARTP